MSVNKKMTNIADAIRSKTGNISKLSLDEMETEIKSIDATVFSHSKIPYFVKTEISEIISKIKEKQNDKTITFLAVSDAHHLATNENIVNGNTHAGMALKSIAYSLNLDFACCLGDLSWGGNTTTIEEGKKEIETVNKYISEAFDGLVQFRTVGNHDALCYSYTQNGEILSNEYLFSMFGKYNEGAVYGSETSGYCYRDFDEKKIRVICLNTSELTVGSNASPGRITVEQQEWFANVLKDIGSKIDASEWGVIILSHHPLDWGSVAYASNILKSYIDGTSIMLNGTTYDFAESNNATIIAQIHGHLHNFKVDKLHSMNTSTWTVEGQYPVKRVAIPNMCFSRTNEYGQNSGNDSNGIEFGTTEVYNKTANTAEDTSFCVCVVNPLTSMIYAFCYGAGVDREIYYGDENIEASSITLDKTSGTLKKGDTVQLTATILPSDTTDKTVTWETSNSAVATVTNGLVTAIKAGNATITAKTNNGHTATYNLTVEITNLIDIYGYKDGVRLSASSGTESPYTEGVTTGFISVPTAPFTARFKGAEMMNSGGSSPCAYGLYNESKARINSSGSQLGYSGDASEFYQDGEVYVFHFKSLSRTVKYMRFSGKGSGTNLICAIDEEII